MARPATAAPPGIQVRAAEVELATRTVLLGRDSSLRRELSKRVPVDAKVFGRMSRVEPVIAVPLISVESFGKRDSDLLRKLIYELADNGSARAFPVVSPSAYRFLPELGSHNGGKPRPRRLIRTNMSQRLALV